MARAISKSRRLCILAALTFELVAASSAMAAERIGLIVRTWENPAFARMRDRAQAEAETDGLELQSFAGRVSGDVEGQVDAIESLIASHAKGFMIVPNDSTALIPAIEKARDAGLFVIVLDSPLTDVNAADITFATDNFRAGVLIGEYARARLGEGASTARIAMLNGALDQTADLPYRATGFMTGFGINGVNPEHWGDEDDARICGHLPSGGNPEGGRTALETLLQRCPDINVVFTVNEPAAFGAIEALKAAGRDDGSVLVVSVDGSCAALEGPVADGTMAATSQQYLLNMAAMGVEALDHYIKTGEKPEPTPGLNFLDTGVALVTNSAVAGVESITAEEAMGNCF